MENKLGSEPAFTTSVDIEKLGMSKRFYTACAAMQGLLANPDWAKSAKIPDDFDEYKDRVISASFEIADELLKTEENEYKISLTLNDEVVCNIPIPKKDFSNIKINNPMCKSIEIDRHGNTNLK